MTSRKGGDFGMSRAATLLFAMIVYAIFFATFLYLIAFVGDFRFVGSTVDSGRLAPPLGAALIDIALIALFGLQHSVMARPGFKSWWTRIVPRPIERSIFVLAASIALMMLFRFWRPIDPTVWNVTNPGPSGIIWLLFWAGWSMVLVSTFLINHFELFGVQQARLHCWGLECGEPQLTQPFFYKWIAHPLYSGFFLAFWATPHMSVGHLLLAGGLSIYMLIAIRYEEHDLTGIFGDDYRRYRAGVGMLTPRFRRRSDQHSAA